MCSVNKLLLEHVREITHSLSVAAACSVGMQVCVCVCVNRVWMSCSRMKLQLVLLFS